ncbi:trypsin-1-like [Amblyomma americanum]
MVACCYTPNEPSDLLGLLLQDMEGGCDRQTPKEAAVAFVSQAQCVAMYGSIILESILCAKGAEQDACQGDSGGPLMSSSHTPGRVVQMGIVSTAIGCGRKGHPGIYT